MEQYYEVSNYGNVRSLHFGKKKNLVPYLTKNGYWHFHTSINGKLKNLSIARSVAKAFPEICGEWFEGCTVDHIDTNKDNNNATNLRVCTLKENKRNPLTIAKITKYTKEERIERKRMQRREEYQRHKEYYKNYMKKYVQEHREELNEYQRKKYRTEKAQERAKRYYQEHKEEFKTRAQKYYQLKKECNQQSA